MIVKRSAKLSEGCRTIELVTSLLTKSKSAGNSKLFVLAWDGISFAGFEQKSMVFCAAINCRNDSKSKVSTFKFPEDPKLRKEWLIKMKRESFEPTKHSRICADHFTADCFQQNLAIMTSLGSTFKPRWLNLKKRCSADDFQFREEKKMWRRTSRLPEEQNGSPRKPRRKSPSSFR